MARSHPRKVVEKTYYYGSDSESDDGHVARFVFPDGDESWIEELTSEDESESESEEEEEISDSEEGTDYESETEPESDSEILNDPKPYYGKGYRVYFDSHEDKKNFLESTGLNTR